MSVFHRVDDMSSMGSRRWSRLVPRLFAYAGAVRLRAQVMASESRSADVEHDVHAGGGGEAPVAPDGTVLLAGPPSSMSGGQEVEATATALQFSDIGDMFSFS